MLRAIKRLSNKLFGWPRLEFNDRVLWARGCTQVIASELYIIQEQADWLLANPTRTIVIEGHCSELEGSREECLLLGDQRSKAHRDRLVKLGVDRARMETISYGRERLQYNPVIDPNADAKNQRTIVELY